MSRLIYLAVTLCIVGLSLVEARTINLSSQEILSTLAEAEKDFTPKEKKDLENLTEIVSPKFNIHNVEGFFNELMKRHTGSTEGLEHLKEAHVIKPCKKLIALVEPKLYDLDPNVNPYEIEMRPDDSPFNSLATVSVCLRLIYILH